ncbi:MAG: ATP-binding protein [Verrucomicrobiota bacterium]
MLSISAVDIEARLLFDNPWWGNQISALSFANLPEREYLAPFYDLATDLSVRRAIVLLGPRRVGKTVILHQTIHRLLKNGIPGNRILFVSLETPVYTDIPLARFVEMFRQRFNHSEKTKLFLIFDEVQYLKNWEVHLKSLVDSWPDYRFLVSGSAAAALKLKSNESGAGRFTDFLLPPLTFHEFLGFIGKSTLVEPRDDLFGATTTDISALNDAFLQYLNIGGYPEAVFNPTIRDSPERFIKSDIIDKVLLRDLPQLYGIRDIQELNRLFTTLAYNTGNEVSLEELSQSSGVAKTTLRRYIEYLEAAFLIRRIDRIDRSARRFERATSFKVYLTNPTMRAALFGHLGEDDQAMGALAETAIYCQWFHDSELLSHLHYARWPQGEVDIVSLDPRTQKPRWCVEVKWSDRPAKDMKQIKHLVTFAKEHRLDAHGSTLITTKTVTDSKVVDGIKIDYIPTSLYAYQLGKNLLQKMRTG